MTGVEWLVVSIGGAVIGWVAWELTHAQCDTGELGKDGRPLK